MKNSITLGVSGDAASFSEEAGLLYAKNLGITPNLEYLIDMEGVLAAVENRTINIGIFPVVNLRGGLVRMAYEAMGHHQFKVIDELWLNVHQCLLIKPDMVANQIKYIVSHSQAIAQCRQYLHKNFNHAELIEWQDTAKAAKELSQGKLPPMTAVIAPERAAHIYRLKVIAKDIQDDNPNLTAFITVLWTKKSRHYA
jgi:prephenate dehydratase